MTSDQPLPPDPHGPLLPPDHHRPHGRGPVILAVAAGAAVVAVAAVVMILAARDGARSPADPPTALEAAKQQCAEHSPDVRIGDDGASMDISRAAAEEDPGATADHVFCILNELDIPDAVVSHIESTRALDGSQDAEWDRFTASWTYHPDDGLNIILQESG